MTFHCFKIASKQNIIRDVLYSAKSSNLATVVHEDRLLSLTDGYLMEEKEEEEVESDQGQLGESLISRSTQEAEVTGVGLAEEEPSTSSSSRIVEIESEEESSGDQDIDLVTDLEGNVEHVSERHPELEKIKRFDCGCKLKLASGETCIKQFTADWIFNQGSHFQAIRG
ncbi:hypothetical protein PoB_005324000 [Plakobranchus ocellatus]|uniref:Uncharacterized protein n=1 Tax=Plakobranchus ocellatus TaxID=259542 RepID=A0AAV4C517_9GAST|nr:hypothetical protein PoB_005324000 [Plakobranchus ocellatus]